MAVMTITLFKLKLFFSHKSSRKLKKKLALTWLDDSWKLAYINQSRFYNFFHMAKFKNV